MISFAEPDPAWNRCYRIPAGGRRMEMDWEHVARAFEAAQAQLGWDAEVVLTPKEQNAVVLQGRRTLVRKRRLRVAVTSSEAAGVRITGRLSGVARFRAARRQLPAPRRVVVTVRITKKTARKLRRTLRRKRVIAALTIRARGAAGNERRVVRRVKIPRRR